MDVAHGEMVEKELDTLITRRSKEVDPDEEHALWKAGVERQREERRLQERYEWHLHHVGHADRLRRTLEELIAHHEEQAARFLEEDQPKGA